jgi:futalosine hydrolase
VPETDLRGSRLTGLGPVMLVAAAPAEGRAVLAALGGDLGLAERPWTRHGVRAGVSVVISGVGKVNGAGAVLRALDERDALVLSVGVAGALPAAPATGGLGLGDVVVATSAVYADEGMWDSRDEVGVGGYVDCAAMGFPLAGAASAGGRFEVDGQVLEVLEGAGAHGAVATVSTCSANDDLARRVAARTGAVAEAMEGAAVAHVLERVRMGARTGVSTARFGELRVISNTTGNRERQAWDLKAALARLTEVLGRLAGA